MHKEQQVLKPRSLNLDENGGRARKKRREPVRCLDPALLLFANNRL
jgi:hypothetical protein